MAIQIFTRLGDIPPYNDDVFVKGDPEPVADMKAFIAAADALLIVSPEYNYGVPGVLKNAIDWASRPSGKSVLNRKPAALMGCSPGLGGTIRCQHALRQSFVFTETHVMSQPEIKIPSAAPLFDASRQTHRREYPPACSRSSLMPLPCGSGGLRISWVGSTNAVMTALTVNKVIG